MGEGLGPEGGRKTVKDSKKDEERDGAPNQGAERGSSTY